jgi:hypothetical protein
MSAIAIVTFVGVTSHVVTAQRAAVLRGVKQITVDDTVIGNAAKVKEDFAPTLVA